MNDFTLLVKVIELTGLTVLIIFAIQGGGTKALLIFMFVFCKLSLKEMFVFIKMPVDT